MQKNKGNEGGNILKKILGNLWDILYPRRCAVCDSVLGGKEMYVCKNCISLPVRIEGAYCLKCGKPVSGEKELCKECRETAFTFTAGRAAFVYDTYMRRSITNFKYHGRQEYARFYADTLYQMYGEEVKKTGADALIPVPIHRERRKKRGYNQALVLAEEFGRYVGIPVYGDFLVRTKKTAPQKELAGTERLRNLYEAFSINDVGWELSKKINCVIIMDDIYTTGSTMEACSRVLKDSGIERIYFLCVCTGQIF